MLMTGLFPRSAAAGFTLIEIMVVVVILSILALFVVPQVMDKPDQARMTKAHQDLRAIETALDLYKLDNFRYPTTDQGLEALVERPTTPPIPNNWKQAGYLKRLPMDPWGNPYRYLSPGRNGEYDIYTLGADNQEGGEGPDADIATWDLQ